MAEYTLSKWSLDDLLKNPTRSTFDKKLAELNNYAREFEKQKKFLNKKISSKKLLELIHKIEHITEKSSIIGGYASLQYSENTQSDEATSLLTRISQFGSEIENRLLFFDLWWKKQIDEKNAQRLIKSSGEFSQYLEFKRILAKYSLSEYFAKSLLNLRYSENWPADLINRLAFFSSICFFHHKSKNSNLFSISEPNFEIRVSNDVASSDCVFSE